MTKNNPGWNFDNSYAGLPQLLFTKQNPTSVHSPEFVVFNHQLASDLGLNADSLQNEEGLAVFAGNQVPAGAMPLAQAYAGHQFGHFTKLGDGRALLLGEQITPNGEQRDIQLKGPGRTPYSRGGDGRAALGPMLREYIISEAMHALKIPTTRSLAVVETGEPVFRETALPGAILTRIAASHIRVGTFQFAAAWGSVEDLRTLADYTIKRHYPEVETDKHPYLSFLKQVIRRQADLIAKWQLVGFIHGVMNTDNMTISGETIDYGPCAFMDIYDPATVFSSIDREGRYAYGNQPYIGGWNLARLAEALVPLFHDDEEQALQLAQGAISGYSQLYQQNWLKGMRAKLGLFTEETADEALIEQLLNLMKQHKADYTNTFRALTLDKPEETGMVGTSDFTDWYRQWKERLSRQSESTDMSLQLMRSVNPGVIPRNHRVEEALKAAEEEDYSLMQKLLKVLSAPYAYNSEQDEYCKLPVPSNIPYKTYCGT